jgi:hypothetical protein
LKSLQRLSWLHVQLLDHLCPDQEYHVSKRHLVGACCHGQTLVVQFQLIDNELGGRRSLPLFVCLCDKSFSPTARPMVCGCRAAGPDFLFRVKGRPSESVYHEYPSVIVPDVCWLSPAFEPVLLIHVYLYCVAWF